MHIRIMEIARIITLLLAYAFDVDIGRIDHPESERETIEIDLFIANPSNCVNTNPFYIMMV